MESRLPKRKIAVSDRANRLAANHVRFGEDFPRVPFSLLHQENPPLYQSNRTRATSPDLRDRVFPDRYLLRRSRSISDLTQSKLIPLKRGAAATIESIPAKFAKVNAPLKPPTTGGFTVPKPLVNASKSTIGTNLLKTTASGISSKPLTVGSSSVKAVTNVKKVTKAPSAVAAKSSVKRIPAYDYKARFNDLSEKHKALKDKYAEKESLAEEAERMELQLAAYAEQTTEMRNELEFLQEQLATERARNKHNEETVRKQRDLLNTLESEAKVLKEDIKTLTNENQTIRPALERLEIKHKAAVEENDGLKNKMIKSEELLFESNRARKQIHNDLLDLKGNIRVFCRVRPQLDFEKHRPTCSWQCTEDTVEISTVDGGKKLKHDFSFDQVFAQRSTQTEVFELVSPLIQSAFDGYNVCIFAYGQTGSGKTFTMEGTESQLGIIPNTVHLLFSSVENYKLAGWSYNISVTFLEIYNEVLYDLLSNEPKELEIRMANQKTDREIYVSNLTEYTVETTDDLRELIEVAHSHRATAATVGNERSSRSHAVTQIKLIGTHDGRGEQSVGKINLIDLAGSESPKTSNRMDETKNINRSLSELTNVIMALLNHNDHIPYRNSKLTHLLMPCLGGNSKTLMFINVAPFDDCFKESVKSLRFAANVNACKLNKVRKNKTFVEQV